MPLTTGARRVDTRKSAIALIMLASGTLLATSARGQQYASANLYEPASCEEVERSGCPWECACWAKPQAACDYIGYYVGGGASRYGGRPRCPAEGTWGWDYFGRWYPRRVRLAWFCYPRSQGGEGQYQPDGPRVVEALREASHNSSH